MTSEFSAAMPMRCAALLWVLMIPTFAGAEGLPPADPFVGDSRARVDGLLGKPNLVRHAADGVETAKYDRGIVVYRDGKAVELRLESAEAVENRAARNAADAAARARTEAARTERLRKEDALALRELIGSAAFANDSLAGKRAAVARLVAYHPYADVARVNRYLDGLAETKPPAAPVARTVRTVPFAEVVRSRFSEWDANRDGRWQPEEIDLLQRSLDITGDSAAAIAAIKGFRRRVEAAGGFFAPTEEELVRPGLAVAVPGSGSPPYEIAKAYAYYAFAARCVSRTLFTNGLPAFARLTQSDAGNCCLYAAAGALAKTDPQRLRDMIAVNADGSYAVRLGTGETIAVAPISDSRLIQNTGVETLSDGVWMPVLEEAVSRRLVVRHGGDTPADETVASTGGTSPAAVLRLFGGKNGVVYVLRNAFSRDSTMSMLAADIASALSARRIVIASMSEKPPVTNGPVPGLSYSHAYAVTGYDAVSGRVLLWNPWANDFTPSGPEGVANGYRTVHGEFSVPLGEFHDQFGHVSFEGR